MLEIIIAAILILSVVYGFRKFFAKPSSEAQDKKSKQFWLFLGNHVVQHAAILTYFLAQENVTHRDRRSLQPTQKLYSFFEEGKKNGLTEKAKWKEIQDFLRPRFYDSRFWFYNLHDDFMGNDASFVGFSLGVIETTRNEGLNNLILG